MARRRAFALALLAATFVVAPARVGERSPEDGAAAIGFALARWGLELVTVAEVRRCVSPAKILGDSAVAGWATLRRWARMSRSDIRDIYRQLCHALGLNPAATAAAAFYAVSAHVEPLGRERIHPVFLLDEAHLLHQDTLDHLHILLNYEWDSRALLSLILVGLSDLQGRLELRKNRSLYSRIERRLSIGAMVPDDTGEYVRLRMSRAGADRDVFTATSSPRTLSACSTRRLAQACARSTAWPPPRCARRRGGRRSSSSAT
ncbi:ATP-binding protein [Sorangium sp. So ce1014]|uniref:AAA family ATPase n=1 Tax=Sorangium sp. So ce1014 TaxID=3133326 RepID=UPI003F63637A